MAKFCGKCGKPIEESIDYCPDCEAKLIEEETVTLNPSPAAESAPIPEAPMTEAAPVPKPAPKPEYTRPVVNEFPIVRIPPRAAAIAEEKKAVKTKLLMLIGIVLAALVCVAALTFGIYKLATRPDKDKDDSPKDSETTLSVVEPEDPTDDGSKEPDKPENSVSSDDKKPENSDKPEELTGKDILAEQDEYEPYRDTINAIHSYLNGEGADITTENSGLTEDQIATIKSILSDEEDELDSYGYDLIDINNDGKYELVFARMPDDADEDNIIDTDNDIDDDDDDDDDNDEGAVIGNTDDGNVNTADINKIGNADDTDDPEDYASQVLFIFEIIPNEETGTTELSCLISYEEGVEYYLNYSSDDNYRLIKHFTDAQNTEKYVIFDSYTAFKSGTFDREFVLGNDGNWYEMRTEGVVIDDNTKDDKKAEFLAITLKLNPFEEIPVEEPVQGDAQNDLPDIGILNNGNTQAPDNDGQSSDDDGQMSDNGDSDSNSSNNLGNSDKDPENTDILDNISSIA